MKLDFDFDCDRDCGWLGVWFEKMYKSVVVYKGEELLGEVEIYPQLQLLLQQQQEPEQEEDEDDYVEENKKKKKRVIDEILGNKQIRISHFSQASERCPPLAVLHTITSSGVCFKMESKNSLSPDSPLHLLHSSCFQENKVYSIINSTHKKPKT